MPDIKGTIVIIRDFLANDVVKVKITGASECVFKLEEDRVYIIPDFQREIRWTPENLIELMNDISRQPKFLGNIILTRDDQKHYSIIDGQQRTTLLRMIVRYIASTFGDELPPPPKMCELKNEAFAGYERFQENSFSYEGIPAREKDEIQKSDKYNQAERYQMLWSTIQQSGIIPDATKARAFQENLFRCSFNIILSEEDTTNYSIEYFLDVNLKGIKLDTEDIFKGYLFYLDPRQEIRQIWVELKQAAQSFNAAAQMNHRVKKDCYPLMKIIEHFMYCYLYDNAKYVNVVFGEDFCLKQKVQIDSTMHYVGEHVLKVINNNAYIQEMLNMLIKFLRFATDVVESEAPGSDFKNLFVVDNPNQKVDHDDIVIIHKFIKMIMLDRKVMVSKAFVMKYAINTLFNGGNNTVDAYKEMYAVQMYITLFSIFENKKGIEPVEKILKSSNWEKELTCAIKLYCNKTTIADRKRGAEFKFSTSPDNEEQRYHSIALAAAYNYFEFRGEKLRIRSGKTKELLLFLTSPEEYSTEHFIINQSGKSTIKYSDSEDYFEYEYPDEIKKYAASIFNFIYIPRQLNRALGNKIVTEKIQCLSSVDIACNYSKVVLQAAEQRFKDIPALNAGEEDTNKSEMDKYFAYDFKQQYSALVSAVLKAVADQFSM